MMHFEPELVRPLSESGDGSNRKFKFTAMKEGWAWAERQWSQVSKDTGIGNPKAATAGKGQKYFTDLTNKISEFLIELGATDNNQVYD